MNEIPIELQSVQNRCEHEILGSKLIACVPSMVRVDIRKTNYKQLTTCFQFPEFYPTTPLLIELKSKTLNEIFLRRLTKLCDIKCKELLGKHQILEILKFLRQFLEDNPLAICSEEIASLKLELNEKDELKLKKKSSFILLTIVAELYFLKVKTVIPDDYPEQQVGIELIDCNFPLNFKKWFIGQSVEIARQCTQKPFKPNPKEPPFEPKLSLEPSMKFLIQEVKRYPSEPCQLCKQICFPKDPSELFCDKSHDKHIERVYCGHIFHNVCLDTYMKTPPFKDGKKCPKCKQRICNEKWNITPKLAEDRWAHREAKTRELGEVVEFFE